METDLLRSARVLAIYHIHMMEYIGTDQPHQHLYFQAKVSGLRGMENDLLQLVVELIV